MVNITVPATSANLGSGFDSLGLAVGLYNQVQMEFWEKIWIESIDGTPIPTDEHNLVYQTAKRLFNLCGRSLAGLHIRQTSAIPLARGLGSSSACIVAGLLGANLLLGKPLSLEELINQAATLEGHPDNTTPAFVGGQVTAVLEGSHVYYCQQKLGDDLMLVAFIPDFKLKTSQARSALPHQVDHRDAVYSLSRAALMAVSLGSGQYQNLRVACNDKLHQPYRLKLIPGGKAILEQCIVQGAYAAYISGAGSTLMAIMTAKEVDIFIEKMCVWMDNQNYKNWKIVALAPDNNGATVTSF